MKRNIFFFIILLIITSCGNNKTSINKPIDMEYAKGLEISSQKDYTKITILDPWNEGKALQTYILVSKSIDLPQNLPQGTVIRTPLSNALVYSSVHTSIIKEITGSYNDIGSVCDAQYFSDNSIKSLIKSGKIKNCGSTMSPSIESIINNQPDAIILSPFQNAGYGQIARIGIPIIECADYMENSPLGRAEWIKLFGLLFEKEQTADSIFNQVKTNYLSLKHKVATVKSRPKVITEMVINGVWYVPGGSSYMAKLIDDAAGNYPWKDDTSTGSLQLDFSQVFDKAHDADVWIIKDFKEHTHASLKEAYELNAKMDAFAKNGIYVCNTQRTNLYDDFPFHPDKLLNDYITIFHPSILTGSKPHYFKQVIN